jgi:hypothetical protein
MSQASQSAHHTQAHFASLRVDGSLWSSVEHPLQMRHCRGITQASQSQRNPLLELRIIRHPFAEYIF